MTDGFSTISPALTVVVMAYASICAGLGVGLIAYVVMSVIGGLRRDARKAKAVRA
jgi:hypothetical protein